MLLLFLFSKFQNINTNLLLDYKQNNQEKKNLVIYFYLNMNFIEDERTDIEAKRSS